MPIDNDVIRTNMGLRYYLILDEIHHIFYKNKLFGSLDFVEADELIIESTRYCGYYVSYGLRD
jgi:hypothetical protein